MTARSAPVRTRTRLVRQVRDLERRLGVIDPVAVPDLGDDLDLVSHNSETVLTLTVREGLVTKLRRTRDALDRIEAGAYGMCLICDAAIAPLRLAAIPEAERCWACQVAAELKED